MSQIYDTRIKLKKDTEGNWTQSNPLLLDGELILVNTDSGELRAKVGDGTKTYTQLPFTDEILKNLITNKQNKLTGSQGQVVGFDSSGNAVAQEAPQTGMTQDQADQRYLQKTGGNASGNIGVASGDGKLELQVNTAGDTQTLAFIDNILGNAYISNTGGTITLRSDSGFLLKNSNKDLVLTGGNFVSATAPSNDNDLTNKAYVDNKVNSIGLPLAFGPQTVATYAWASNSTYPDYPYRAAVVLSHMTADYIPDVAFGMADAVSGNLAPLADTYDGGVYIYAKQRPTAAVNIASVVCTFSGKGEPPVFGEFQIEDPGGAGRKTQEFIIGQTWSEWMETDRCTVDLRIVGNTVEMNPVGVSGYGWIVYEMSDSHNVAPDEKLIDGAVYSASY